MPGSSPRMRGTPGLMPRNQGTFGIIPAYAGNTDVKRRLVPDARDHPRVCGEHLVAGIETDVVEGSSPRMRGTLERRGHDPYEAGIIPAYAGNTKPWTSATTPCEDHPRVCGEHTASISISFMYWGSSPRMRGTRCVQLRPCRQPGIIPAYAGNTRQAC